MKVAIGSKIIQGPWGGGNQFAISLCDYLKKQGVQLRFNLDDPDLDLILLTEPRGSLGMSCFDEIDVFHYLWRKNPQALVMHRVNECDERKGTRLVNRALALANSCADHTVFISEWLAQLFTTQTKHAFKPHTVILNGGDPTVFNRAHYRPWLRDQEKLRLVTHHWGGNWLKGFDIYSQFDSLLGSEEFSKDFAFTYIGKVPAGFEFRHTTHLQPLSGQKLGAKIAEHHVYVSASVNEPAGMHHIEGALCGLPLLYRNSGALPQYCQGFGVSFDSAENFPQRLRQIKDEYETWLKRMPEYTHTSEEMCSQYYRLMIDLQSRRQEILRQRNWDWKNALSSMARSAAFRVNYRISDRLGWS